MKEALDRLVNRLSGQKQLGHHRDNNKQVLGSINCKGDAKSDLCK